ncbi:Uncharacterized protein TCM_019278 isoform 1 [Theobroma cacao]|uniref:Uncharacterized protein isoform 1 n=1 Tax=Theobroma cacao TaxID=3641 RepID=A0A061EH78_THECC|nr:Uncharacterized protein TCM_019278 isoform 1 [Theobroma cacao]
MQDPRMPPSEEDMNPKLWKKKSSTNKAPSFPLERSDIKGAQQVLGSLPLRTGQKTSKRNLKKEISPIFQQPERSNSDSIPDSSTSGNEYRALRRKYLLLEEESFALGKELKDVVDEVKVLEDEKFALLDQLVVLEGLVDPSEMQSQGAFLEMLLSENDGKLLANGMMCLALSRRAPKEKYWLYCAAGT